MQAGDHINLINEYEKFLATMSVEDRELYWVAIFKDLPPMMSYFADDPLFIARIEKRLCDELNRIEVDSRPYIEGEIAARGRPPPKRRY